MFGLTASIMWGLHIGILIFYHKDINTFVIGIFLFLILYKNVDLEQISKLQIVFHATAWGYAIVSAIIPLVYEYPFFLIKYYLLFSGSFFLFLFDPL